MIENTSTRRDFLQWAGSVAATALGTRFLQAAEPSRVSRPNILFIMVDDNVGRLLRQIESSRQPHIDYDGLICYKD